jgi:hypothetical protein
MLLVYIPTWKEFFILVGKLVRIQRESMGLCNANNESHTETTEAKRKRCKYQAVQTTGKRATPAIHADAASHLEEEISRRPLLCNRGVGNRGVEWALALRAEHGLLDTTLDKRCSRFKPEFRGDDRV